MKKQTLLMVMATIAILLGSYGSSFAKKLKADNFKIIETSFGKCIMLSPASVGFTGDMTRYEDLRAKVEGKKVKVNGEKYIVECCPSDYPDKFYKSYKNPAKKDTFDFFVITQQGTDFYMLRAASKGRWLDHFLPDPPIPMLKSVNSMWSDKGEFVFHLKKAS